MLQLVEAIQHPVMSTPYEDMNIPDAGSTANLVANFETFAVTLLGALESTTCPMSVDWVTAQTDADRARYTLYRFKDTATHRWLVYAQPQDASRAHFIFNPDAKRNVAVQVPHAGKLGAMEGEANVKEQGAQLLMGLTARALFINGHSRCGGVQDAGCKGENRLCSGGTLAANYESDVAHDTDNAFHLMHQVMVARGGVAGLPGTAGINVLQIHGMDGTNTLDISDGSNTDAGGLSSTLADLIAAQVDGGTLNRCQEDQGTLCGARNVQGLYLNFFVQMDAGFPAICTGSNPYQSNQFIHLEQTKEFRAGDQSWLISAMNALPPFSTCSLGGSSGTPDLLDCELGGWQ